MKNKVLLLIALIALGLLSGCGQNNNQKQKEDLSEFGNYYGDSDDPADDEFVDDGDDIAIRAIPINSWDYVFIFATTADGNSYYLYDDEMDYENALFPYVIIQKAFESTDREQLMSTTKKWNPYLTKVYDLPQISGVPNDLKEALVKAYYDYKDKLFYLKDKGYGFQTYIVDGEYITLQRYNSKTAKKYGVPSDVPEGAFMVSKYNLQ